MHMLEFRLEYTSTSKFRIYKNAVLLFFGNFIVLFIN